MASVIICKYATHRNKTHSSDTDNGNHDDNHSDDEDAEEDISPQSSSALQWVDAMRQLRMAVANFVVCQPVSDHQLASKLMASTSAADEKRRNCTVHNDNLWSPRNGFLQCAINLFVMVVATGQRSSHRRLMPFGKP